MGSLVKLSGAVACMLLLLVFPALAAGGATYAKMNPREYGPRLPWRTVEMELANNLKGVFIYRTAASVGSGQSVSIDGRAPTNVETETFIYKTIRFGAHKLIVPDGASTRAYDFSVVKSDFGWVYIRLNVLIENGVTTVVPTFVDHETAKTEIRDCRYLN
jgi:hypothetical protein